MRLPLLVLALALVASPPRGEAAVLTVDDLGDPGQIGDGELTLREAIRLATGDIACTSLPVPACTGLSPAELARVAGTPGAAIADTIGFAVAGTIDLVGTGSAELLPPLDAGSDTIDGQGQIVLSGLGVDPGPILWGWRIISDGNEIRGLAFEDIPGTAAYIGALPGDSASGNRIVDNRFTRSGFDAIRVVAGALTAPGADVAGGVVEGTVIEGNTIETATPGNLVRGFPPAAINLMAAYVPVAGHVHGARLTDTTIAGNTIRDVFQGLFARGGVGAGTMTGNELGGLTVRDNVFERVNDQVLYVGPATVEGDGASSDNVVQDVLITRNAFQGRILDPAAPYLGGGPFVSGGFIANCGLTTGTPTSVRDVTKRVVISDNVVTDRAPYGIVLQGAQSCGGAGGSLTEALLEDVTVSGNTIERCDTGISLTGGSSFLTGGGLENARNTIRGVTVVGNTANDNTIVGVELIGGVSYGGDSDENTIEAVTIQGNSLSGNDTGVAATAGVTIATGNRVRGNAIRTLRIVENTIADSTRAGVLLQGAGISAGSTGTDNVVGAPEVIGNVLDRTQGAGIVVLAVTIADGATADGNRVNEPLIQGNVVRDTVAGPPEGPRGVGILLVGRPGNGLVAARLVENVIERVATTGIVLAETDGHFVLRNQVLGFGTKAFQGKWKKNVVKKNTFRRGRNRRR